MSMEHNIAVVDRRPLILECVTRMFAELVNTGHQADIAFTVLPFLSCEELCRRIAASDAAQGHIDVVIFGISSSTHVQDEIDEMLNQFQDYRWDIPVVILSECDNRREIFEAFRRGVRGYIHASMNAEQAMDALRLVLHGGTYIPECILSGEDTEAESPILSGSLGRAATEVMDVAPTTRLTPRQRDVLNLLRKGLSNRVIAEELSMREGTVKVHVAHIMRKLHARNRTHAAFLADQIALLSSTEGVMAR